MRQLLPHFLQRFVIEADDRDILFRRARFLQHATQLRNDLRADLNLHEQFLAARDRCDLFLQQRNFFPFELRILPTARIEFARFRLGDLDKRDVATRCALAGSCRVTRQSSHPC